MLLQASTSLLLMLLANLGLGPVLFAEGAARSQSGAIVGTITSSEASQNPIAGAVVTLSSAAGGERIASSDGDGRFVFSGLVAGRYLLRASRPGYVTQYFGAKRAGVAAGVPIVVGPTDTVTISLPMAAASVISGRLLLPPGVPVSSLRIHLLSRSPIDREFRSAMPGAYGVDDEGAFRISRLSPGEYQLFVTVAGSAARFQTAEGGYRTFAPTFYPGTLRADEAGSLTLIAGEERKVQFAIDLVSAVRISGQVTDPAGQPVGRAQVVLWDKNAPMPRLSFQVDEEPNGQFAIQGVTPGEYVLAIRATSKMGAGKMESQSQLTSSDAALWAEHVMTVGATDMSVNIQARPGRSVTGRMVLLESEAPTRRLPAKILLVPFSVNNQLSIGPREAEVGIDGRFNVDNVTPGRYEIRIAATDKIGPLSLESAASQTGNDLLDTGLLVSAGEDVADLVLRVTASETVISGRLLDSVSQPVSDYFLALFSVDRKHWTKNARRTRHVRPDSRGEFTFSDLQAGDYYICALSDLDPAQLSDSTFLELLVGASLRVQVSRGETKRQDIRLTTGK